MFVRSPPSFLAGTTGPSATRDWLPARLL